VTTPQDAATRRFPTDGPLDLRVHLDYGSVRVRIKPALAAATVRCTPSIASRDQDLDAAQSVRVGLDGTALDVRGTASGWRRLVRPGSADVDIELPEGSSVSVTTSYAEVGVAGPVAECSVRTTGGDIRVEEADRVRLETKYGSVTLGRVTGGGHLESTHGNLRVQHAAGAVDLTASSGDVELGHAAGDLTVRNTYGAVRVDALSSGTCAVTTSYGSVDIGIPTGTAAYLDVQSDNGRVRSELDPTDAPGPHDDRAAVTARSHYGSITIRRA
jgi:hypothetical protein